MLMEPALRQAAALSGSSANMMGIAVAQGKQEMVSGWATAAAIFKEMSGYLYAVLQALVLAMGPLVIIAMFIPGTGLKLVGSYMQVAVWLALWQPLLSIVNYIVLLYSQAQSTAVLDGSSGFTMQNLPVVSEFTSRMILAGSFMATLVPLFAWGMVKGGMAVTDLITRGLSNQIMSQAGNVAATGNVTLGNESMDDNTIDQNMLMPKYSVGYGMATAGIDSASILTDSQFGGNSMSIAGQRVSVAAMRSAQESYNTDMSRSKAALSQVSQTLGAALSADESFSANMGNGTSTAVGYNSQNQTGNQAETGKQAEVKTTGAIGAGNTTTTTNTHETGVTTGASAGIGTGAKLSGGGANPGANASEGGDGDLNTKLTMSRKLADANAAVVKAEGAVNVATGKGYATKSTAQAVNNAVQKLEAVGQSQVGWTDAEKESYKNALDKMKSLKSQVDKSASYRTSAVNSLSMAIPSGIQVGEMAAILGISAADAMQEKNLVQQSARKDGAKLVGQVNSGINSNKPLQQAADSAANAAAGNTAGVPGALRSMGSIEAYNANTQNDAMSAYENQKLAEVDGYKAKVIGKKKMSGLAINIHQDNVNTATNEQAAIDNKLTHPIANFTEGTWYSFIK